MDHTGSCAILVHASNLRSACVSRALRRVLADRHRPLHALVVRAFDVGSVSLRCAGAVCERLNRSKMIWTIASSILDDLSLRCAAIPDLSRLSGIDSALFVLLAVMMHSKSTASYFTASRRLRVSNRVTSSPRVTQSSWTTPLPVSSRSRSRTLSAAFAAWSIGLWPFAHRRPPITIART